MIRRVVATVPGDGLMVITVWYDDLNEPCELQPARDGHASDKVASCIQPAADIALYGKAAS